MFIWDFVADTVLGQITDWVYGQIVGFLGSFFAQMGNMGADLFEMEWVQAIVMFFSCLAWALYVTGLVVAGFEWGKQMLGCLWGCVRRWESAYKANGVGRGHYGVSGWGAV